MGALGTEYQTLFLPGKTGGEFDELVGVTLFLPDDFLVFNLAVTRAQRLAKAYLFTVLYFKYDLA